MTNRSIFTRGSSDERLEKPIDRVTLVGFVLYVVSHLFSCVDGQFPEIPFLALGSGAETHSIRYINAPTCISEYLRCLNENT